MRPFYFVKKALTGMRNASLVSALAVMTSAVSLTLFGIFLVGIINANRLAVRLSKGMEVVVYLKEGVSGESLTSLEEEIKGFSEVGGVEYISKEEALVSLREELSYDSYVLEGLDGNPLPASFVIRMKDGFRNSAGIKAVANRLMGKDPVEDLRYGGEWMERFSAVITMIKFGGMAVGIGLILSVMLIVSSTIRLTIQTRMDEIEIMRLVGATPLFIKVPFIIEGVTVGSLGAFLAVMALVAAKGLVEYSFGNELKLLIGNPDILPHKAVIALLLSGASSGLIGSVLSLWRFPRP